MFSGLGSIADLNQQFAQFTSNLTNLDTLQDGKSDRGDAKKMEESEDVNYKSQYESVLEAVSVLTAEKEAQQRKILELEEETARLKTELTLSSSELQELHRQNQSNATTKLSDSIRLNGEEVDKGEREVDGLVACQLQLQAAEGRNAELIAELSEWKQRFNTAERQNAAETEKKNAEVSRLEAELQRYLDNIVELSDNRSALTGDLKEQQEKVATLEAQLSQVQQMAEQNGIVAQTSLTESEGAQDELRVVRQQHAEAEGKVTTLTEKLKDMMHRFAELKSKSTAQLQLAEEKYRDLTKLAQAKDSEILAFKLKNENVDRSASDLRLKANELAERYSEAQREVARLRESCEAAEQSVASLETERDAALAEARTAVTEKESTDAKVAILTEAIAAQSAEHTSHLSRAQEASARELREAKAMVGQLQAELALVANRMKQDADNAGDLDQYKKKAQLALKKANGTIATLTAEMQQLRTAAEDSAARILEAQDIARDAQEQLAEAQHRLRKAELEATEATVAAAQREQEWQRRAMELEGEKDALHQKMAELEEKLARVLTAEQAHPSKPVTATDAGFVNAHAPLSRSPLREEDASSYASAGSELCAPPVLGGPATAPGGRPGVRESSWAMVASAAGPDSRLSSGHPSLVNMDAGSKVANSDGSSNIDAQEDTSEFRQAPSADSLLFISQLQHQLEAMKKALAQRGIDLEAAHHQLQYERDEKRTLQARVDELRAYLERAKQQDSPDSATSMEYLKNCVFKFMSSTDVSEKRRLYPVIATILKLTSLEMKAVESAFRVTDARDNELQDTLSSIGSFATSSLGSLWGTVLGGGGESASSTTSGTSAESSAAGGQH